MKTIRFLFAITLLWSQFSYSAAAAFLGPAATDGGAFTAGTSPFQPGGCFFQTTATSNPLTTGLQGTIQCTAQRAPFVNLRNSSGAEIGTSASPLFSSLNTTPSLANGNGVVPTQGGSVLSATNGAYTNLLQGNAVLSTGNPLFVTGTGTAGTAAINPVTIQGIASMVPLLVNPGTASNFGIQTQGSTTSGQSGQLIQGAVTTGAPSYTTAQTSPLSLDTAGNLRVNLVTAASNLSSNVAQIGGTNVVSGGVNGSQGVGGLAATGAAVAGNPVYVAGRASGNATPVTVCDNWTPISQTAGTQLFAGTSAKKTYICSINLVTATAQNVALVGGTGTVCATSTHAIAGGTTAATGWNFAANGGLAQGNGNGVIMQAGTAADNVCLLQSSTGQISGAIAWTQF